MENGALADICGREKESEQSFLTSRPGSLGIAMGCFASKTSRVCGGFQSREIKMSTNSFTGLMNSSKV